MYSEDFELETRRIENSFNSLDEEFFMIDEPTPEEFVIMSIEDIEFAFNN